MVVAPRHLNSIRILDIFGHIYFYQIEMTSSFSGLFGLLPFAALQRVDASANNNSGAQKCPEIW